MAASVCQKIQGPKSPVLVLTQLRRSVQFLRETMAKFWYFPHRGSICSFFFIFKSFLGLYLSAGTKVNIYFSLEFIFEYFHLLTSVSHQLLIAWYAHSWAQRKALNIWFQVATFCFHKLCAANNVEWMQYCDFNEGAIKQKKKKKHSKYEECHLLD